MLSPGQSRQNFRWDFPISLFSSILVTFYIFTFTFSYFHFHFFFLFILMRCLTFTFSFDSFRYDFLFSLSLFYFNSFRWYFIFSFSLFSFGSFWWDFIFSHSFFSFDYSGEVSYLSLHFSRLFFILVMFLFFTYPLMNQFFLIKIWKTSPLDILHILGLRWFYILFYWPMQV